MRIVTTISTAVFRCIAAVGPAQPDYVRLASVLIIALCVTSATSVWGLPTVPGMTVEVYAQVDDPIGLTFAPSGELWAGRDLRYSGGSVTAPAKIHKISVGGLSVQEWGRQTLPDPDAVFYDAQGRIAGTPGAVLVAGMQPAGGTGFVTAVMPDQTVVPIFSSLYGVYNIQDFAVDRVGGVLFANKTPGASGPTGDVAIGVMSASGVIPLVSMAGGVGAFTVAVDGSNRIFSSWTDGTIRIHDENGVLINGRFATVSGTSPITFGPGFGHWGSDLYALNGDTGNLLRIDMAGIVQIIGTGFTRQPDQDVVFGPDGNLYVSDPSYDRILRVTPEPGSLALVGLGLVLLRLDCRRLTRKRSSMRSSA